MAKRAEISPAMVPQAEILRTEFRQRQMLLVPRIEPVADELTFSPAAALRAGPGSGLSLVQPAKDPAASLHRLGLQNIDRLASRHVTQEPGGHRGVFARLGALGMAAAYFAQDAALEDARNELADGFEFVPNFHLALPTAVRGKAVNATRGRSAHPVWPEDSGIAAAHAVNVKGSGVLVGVLDTGVDADHAEMSEHTITFRYVSLFPSSPYWPPRDVRGFDPDGHGTHVCGIIAGRTIGVAPEAKLVVASVIESETTRTSLIRVAYGLDWMLRQFSSPANEHHPAVVNMSLGFPASLIGQEGFAERLAVIRRLLQTLHQANVLPIVAVGNDGPGQFGYPAGFEEALGVGAVDLQGRIAGFSGSTPARRKPAKPDIFGYGVDIHSAIERDYQGRSAYQTMSGTSMAAPFVTGIAALLLCRNPMLSAAELRRALLDHARPLDGAPGGAGLAAFPMANGPLDAILSQGPATVRRPRRTRKTG